MHQISLCEGEVTESAIALAATIQLVQLVQVAIRALPGCTSFGCTSVFNLRVSQALSRGQKTHALPAACNQVAARNDGANTATCSPSGACYAEYGVTQRVGSYYTNCLITQVQAWWIDDDDWGRGHGERARLQVVFQ